MAIASDGKVYAGTKGYGYIPWSQAEEAGRDLYLGTGGRGSTEPTLGN